MSGVVAPAAGILLCFSETEYLHYWHSLSPGLTLLLLVRTHSSACSLWFSVHATALAVVLVRLARQAPVSLRDRSRG